MSVDVLDEIGDFRIGFGDTKSLSDLDEVGFTLVGEGACECAVGSASCGGGGGGGGSGGDGVEGHVRHDDRKSRVLCQGKKEWR